MVTLVNNPKLAGQIATTRKELFGECSRYAIAPVHTRFEEVEWFVWDADRLDPVTGTPEVIRQAPTREEALKGLD